MFFSKKQAPMRSFDASLDREIAFHVDALTQENLLKGMPEREARRQALVEFGGREQAKQSVREVYLSPLLEGFKFQLRAAVHFLRKAPAFSVAAIATLALGIGANTAVFSAVDAVVLRPLPFPQGEQLMLLAQRNQRVEDANSFVAPARLEDWNQLNATFTGITGYYKDDFTELSGALPERLTGVLVAPRFFPLMGIAPLLGRAFVPAEEHFGGPSAALISYRLWQREFHGDPAVLHKVLHFGRSSMAIVGVMPATFQFPAGDADLWTPSPPDAPYARDRNSTWFTAIGRLRPGVTPAQARANLQTVQRELGTQFPKPDADLAAELTPLKETVVGGVRSSLWLLYGSVSLLLLIACSNLAALLLARTTDREQELSIRFSLGASRRAVVTQLLAETFSLALIGALLGLLVAAAMLRGLHLLAGVLPRATEITLNWRVMLYSGGCAMATTLLCGVYPALRGTRRELAQRLAQSGRTQASARGSAQWTLVGVQVMLAVVLLTGAGLLLRSLQELGRVSPGFDPAHVLSFRVTGSWGETANSKLLTETVNRRLDALRSLSGVEAAATSAALPGVPGKYQQEFKIDGHAEAGGGQLLADSRFVSSGYLEAVRTPLLLGTACRQGSATVDVMVNRSFVDRYLGGGPALGHEITSATYDGLAPPAKIVGVVGDARESGLNTPPVPTAYFCGSAPIPSPNYLLRTRGDAMGMADAVRRRLHEIEPGRSVYAIVPLTEHLDEAFAEDRLRTVLLACFAGSAVLLACLGLYGTLNHLGRVRHREVGLRLTLGASRLQVGMRFLLQGLRVTAVGCVAGTVLSVAGSRFLAKMLYGVSALDAGTYVAVVLGVFALATVAAAIPARRAAAVEPAEALRG